MRRLLLTGAAGGIATVVRPVLRELAGEVVLTDREAPADAAARRAVRAGRPRRPRPVGRARRRAATRSSTSARCPTRRRSTCSPGPNLHGAFHVYDAARRAGVRRVVAASSGRATGFRRVGERLDGDATPRPDGLYAATKAFSEALGRLYADKFGLEVVALRIGTFLPRPAHGARPLDLAQPRRRAAPRPRRADRPRRRLPRASTGSPPTRAAGGTSRRSWATCRRTTPRRGPATSSRATASRSRAGRPRPATHGGWAG